jgi:hypothetical protein
MILAYTHKIKNQEEEKYSIKEQYINILIYSLS